MSPSLCESLWKICQFSGHFRSEIQYIFVVPSVCLWDEVNSGPYYSAISLSPPLFNVFNQILEVCSHYFFKCCFCLFISVLSFCISIYVHFGMLDGIPQVAQAMFLLEVFFSISFSNWIISVDISSNFLIHSSASLSLLLNFCIEFFTSVIFSKSRIYILFHNFSLLILYMLGHYSPGFLKFLFHVLCYIKA